MPRTGGIATAEPPEGAERATRSAERCHAACRDKTQGRHCRGSPGDAHRSNCGAAAVWDPRGELGP
eukprot:10489301-Alexandrium_andersonii.AAC.1